LEHADEDDEELSLKEEQHKFQLLLSEAAKL